MARDTIDMITDYTLYDTAIAKMDEYKEAEAALTAYVITMPAFQPTSEYFRLKTARDKAKRAFESADKKWKRYYAENK